MSCHQVPLLGYLVSGSVWVVAILCGHGVMHICLVLGSTTWLCSCANCICTLLISLVDIDCFLHKALHLYALALSILSWDCGNWVHVEWCVSYACAYPCFCYTQCMSCTCGWNGRTCMSAMCMYTCVHHVCISAILHTNLHLLRNLFSLDIMHVVLMWHRSIVGCHIWVVKRIEVFPQM